MSFVVPSANTASGVQGLVAGLNIQIDTTVSGTTQYPKISATAGAGSITGILAGSNVTVDNTIPATPKINATVGVTGTTAGNGITITNNNTNPTITNSGILSITGGTGITSGTFNGGATINNVGVISAVAGTGIGVSATTGNVTFSNTGCLSVVPGANITVSSSGGNYTVNSSATIGSIGLSYNTNTLALSDSLGDSVSITPYYSALEAIVAPNYTYNGTSKTLQLIFISPTPSYVNGASYLVNMYFYIPFYDNASNLLITQNGTNPSVELVVNNAGFTTTNYRFNRGVSSSQATVSGTTRLYVGDSFSFVATKSAYSDNMNLTMTLYGVDTVVGLSGGTYKGTTNVVQYNYSIQRLY